nr:MAG TPA: hypothetical protein [Caudoviricetes sp.]
MRLVSDNKNIKVWNSVNLSIWCWVAALWRR